MPWRAGRVLLVLVTLLFAAGCATSPTGRSQLIMVDEGQMASQGRMVFAQMKQKLPVTANPVANARVDCVADALLWQLPPGERDGWEVRVFADKSTNAFAVPGRKIGVFTGMLDLVQNDAQLAAVIGHEIAHVQARHAAERASMGMVSQLGAGVAEVVAPGAGNVVSLGSQMGVLLPYSRAHESEADIMGQALMARAGFDPRESITLWQRMEQKNGRGGLQFLSTHPSPGNRIQSLQRELHKTLPLYERARALGNTPRCSRGGRY